MLKSNLYLFDKKVRNVIVSDNSKTKSKFIKGSVLSIVLGIIISGVIISAQGVNPFGYFMNIFSLAFDPLFLPTTLKWISIYAITGIAIGIGFKAGVFNIGVSGQIVAGSATSIIVYKLVSGATMQTLSPGWTIMLFFMCVISGATLGAFSGILKSKFNIHEVVSTIMMNWIVWYVFQFIFGKFHQFTDSAQTSVSIPNDLLTINGNEWIIPLVIAIGVIVIITTVLSFTKFGMNLKAVGSSPLAAKNAGINSNRKIIEVMAISGALAGVAAFLNICTINPSIQFSTNNLPTIGFDSISIALVAFNNPIGILFVGSFWGIIQSAGSNVASSYLLPQQMSVLIFGIIIYFAAISSILMRVAPYAWVRFVIFWINSKQVKYEKESSRKQIATLKQEFKIAFAKKKSSKDNIATIEDKKLINKALEEMKTEYRLKMRKFKEDQKMAIGEIYKEWNLTGTRRIKAIKTQAINDVRVEKANDLLNLKTSYFYWSNLYLKEAFNKLNVFKKYQKESKKTNKNLVKVAKNWRIDEISFATKRYEKINHIIEAKGKYNKTSLILKEEIIALKSDYKISLLINKNNVNELKQELNANIAKIKTELNLAKEVRKSEIEQGKNVAKQAKDTIRNNPEIITKINQKYLEMIQECQTNNIKAKEEASVEHSKIDQGYDDVQFNKIKQELLEYKKTLSNQIKTKVFVNKSKNNLQLLESIKTEQDHFNTTFSPQMIVDGDKYHSTISKIKLWNEVNRIFNKYKKAIILLTEKEEIIKINNDTKDAIQEFIKIDKEYVLEQDDKASCKERETFLNEKIDQMMQGVKG